MCFWPPPLQIKPHVWLTHVNIGVTGWQNQLVLSDVIFQEHPVCVWLQNGSTHSHRQAVWTELINMTFCGWLCSYFDIIYNLCKHTCTSTEYLKWRWTVPLTLNFVPIFNHLFLTYNVSKISIEVPPSNGIFGDVEHNIWLKTHTHTHTPFIRRMMGPNRFLCTTN